MMPPIDPCIPPPSPPLPPLPPIVGVPVMIPPIVPAQPPTAWGTNVKLVTCHWCGYDFAYLMARSVGGGSRERAVLRLRKILLLDCDAVPCPSCGSYQPNMVRLLKRRHRLG